MKEPACFRLLPYSINDPATNMAIDEAILEARLKERCPPTLRFYGWSPEAISIGYSQKISADTVERARAQGFAIVRRPTGGRAVLHKGELTYAFIGGDSPISADCTDTEYDIGLDGTIIGAYKQICQGLIYGLLELGVELELGATKSVERNLADCFAATTQADLHYRGKKMVGSAQLRRQTAVLQHGSIILLQEQEELRSILQKKASENNREKNLRHANLFEIVGADLSIADLQESLKRGFEKAFARELVQSELSELEKELVDQLRPKYRQLEINRELAKNSE